MRPLLIGCVLAFFAVSVEPVGAQSGPWVRRPGPSGGTLPVLHQTTAGTLLAADAPGFAYRSGDGGATWETVPALDVRAFDSSPGEVLAATDTGLLRSTNDGWSWGAFAFEGFPVRAAARASDGHLFVLRPSGLVRSSDDGRTWSDPEPATGRLVRGQDGRLYRTAEWVCDAFYRCHHVLRWNPGAASWDTLTTRNDRFEGLPGGLDVDAAGTVAFGTYGLGILNTPVGGLHVRRLDGTWSSAGAYVTSVVARPDGVFAGGYDGVYRLGPAGYGRVAPTPAVIAALAGRGSLVAGTGVECEWVLDPPSSCTSPDGGYRIDVTTGGRSALGIGTLGVGVIERGSRDHRFGAVAGGRLWTYARPIVTCAYPCAGRFEEWQAVDAPPLGFDAQPTSLVRTPMGWAVAFRSVFAEAVLVLRNGRWHGLGVRGPVYDLATTASGALLTAGEGGLVRYPHPDTSNVGVSARSGPSRATSVVTVAGAPGVFLAYGTGGVYRSEDDGQTWARVLDDPTPPDESPSGAVGSEPNAWAAFGGSRVQIFESRDVGRTWTARGLIAPTGPEGTAFLNVQGLAVGGRGVAMDLGSHVGAFVDEGGPRLAWDVWRVPGGTGAPRRRLRVGPYGELYVASDAGLLLTSALALDASSTAGREGTGLRVHPNPFREAVTATVDVPTPGPVRAEVFDGLGRRVAVLHDGPAAGPLALRWDAAGAAPGLYVLRVTTADRALTARLVRVR